MIFYPSLFSRNCFKINVMHLLLYALCLNLRNLIEALWGWMHWLCDPFKCAIHWKFLLLKTMNNENRSCQYVIWTWQFIHNKVRHKEYSFVSHVLVLCSRRNGRQRFGKNYEKPKHWICLKSSIFYSSHIEYYLKHCLHLMEIMW